jgi:hypothetical protein
MSTNWLLQTFPATDLIELLLEILQIKNMILKLLLIITLITRNMIV